MGGCHNVVGWTWLVQACEELVIFIFTGRKRDIAWMLVLLPVLHWWFVCWTHVLSWYHTSGGVQEQRGDNRQWNSATWSDDIWNNCRRREVSEFNYPPWHDGGGDPHQNNVDQQMTYTWGLPRKPVSGMSMCFQGSGTKWRAVREYCNLCVYTASVSPQVKWFCSYVWKTNVLTKLLDV